MRDEEIMIISNCIIYILQMIMFIQISNLIIYAQTPEWINYTSGADVRAITEDGEYLWIGDKVD